MDDLLSNVKQKNVKKNNNIVDCALALSNKRRPNCRRKVRAGTREINMRGGLKGRRLEPSMSPESASLPSPHSVIASAFGTGIE